MPFSNLAQLDFRSTISVGTPKEEMTLPCGSFSLNIGPNEIDTFQPSPAEQS